MIKKPKLYEQTGDDCWRISLCHLLKMTPKKVPDFLKLHGDDFVEMTREWLKPMGKGLVFIPFSAFLDTGMKYNHNMFPPGECIAILETGGVDNHACYMIDGELFEDGNEGYKSVMGFCIVYELEPKR